MKEIIVDIQFFSAALSRRRQNIPAIQFNCSLVFIDIPELASHGYDCRIFFDKYGKEVILGDYVENISVAFLSPDEVFPYIKIGTQFYIWNGGNIAQGIITKI